MDYTPVIAKLNEIIKHEWTGVAQYAQAGFIVSGFWREVYQEMFMESATESFGHAQKIGDKIVALGGVPAVERNPIHQSQDLEEILEAALKFESMAVKLYNEALKLAEGDRALEVLLEDILLEEQQGVDDISKLLNRHQAEGGESSVSAAG